jgi:gas vesicle protein
MRVFKYWTAFSLGVAAGTAVALAYAPRTGEKTRKQWKRKLDDTSDYLKDTADDFGKHATKVYSRARDVADDVASQADTFARHVSKHASKVADAVSR